MRCGLLLCGSAIHSSRWRTQWLTGRPTSDSSVRKEGRIQCYLCVPLSICSVVPDLALTHKYLPLLRPPTSKADFEQTLEVMISAVWRKNYLLTSKDGLYKVIFFTLGHTEKLSLEISQKKKLLSFSVPKLSADLITSDCDSRLST